MEEVINHVLPGICFTIAAFVALWCIGMFANWASNGFQNRFTAEQEKEHEMPTQIIDYVTQKPIVCPNGDTHRLVVVQFVFGNQVICETCGINVR